MSKQTEQQKTGLFDRLRSLQNIAQMDLVHDPRVLENVLRHLEDAQRDLLNAVAPEWKNPNVFIAKETK